MRIDIQTKIKTWGNSPWIQIPKEVLEKASISVDDVLDVDELKLTYYSSSGSQAFPLVNSSSYIDGEYSAYCTITSGNGSNLCFTVLVGVKNSKTGDILSEVNFNVNPFITEVPDIK